MKSARVLIASAYYWPEVAGNAPYVTGVAEGLARRGHDVTVLAGFPHYPQWHRRGRFRLGATGQRNGVTVRRRWHYVPGRHALPQRAIYEATLLTGSLTALPLRSRPDVILGVTPSFSAAVLARAAATLYRRPYGIVFQDLMAPAAAQSGYEGGSKVAGALATMELGIARGAAGIGIIAPGFRDYLESGGVEAQRIRRVRNWFTGAPAEAGRAETRRRLNWADDEFICLHAGNMGHKQGLSTVIAAAARIPDPCVRVVLAGDGNERARLEIEAQLAGGNVMFVAPQAPGAYESMLAAADLLLVNQLPAVNDMALPSKLTSYFAAGRPVIAAAAPVSETAREIALAGAGIVTTPGDPPALARAILDLRANPARADELGKRGRRYALAHLDEEAAIDEYEALIEAILGGAGA